MTLPGEATPGGGEPEKGETGRNKHRQTEREQAEPEQAGGEQTGSARVWPIEAGPSGALPVETSFAAADTVGAAPVGATHGEGRPERNGRNALGQGIAGQGSYGKARLGEGEGVTSFDSAPTVHTPATDALQKRLPAAVLVCRLAAEQRRLAVLTKELEHILGASPGLAGAMTGQERQALQRLDYLRQAQEDLARFLEGFAPQGEVDPIALTRRLTLEDVARHLRDGEASSPPPSAGSVTDFFD